MFELEELMDFDLDHTIQLKKTTTNLLTKKNYFTGCDEDGWI